MLRKRKNRKNKILKYSEENSNIPFVFRNDIGSFLYQNVDYFQMATGRRQMQRSFLK